MKVLGKNVKEGREKENIQIKRQKIEGQIGPPPPPNRTKLDLTTVTVEVKRLQHN